MNHSTKELAIGNPTHPTLPALHLTGSVQSACLRRHWRAGVRRGRGSGAAVRGRPNGLQCSRCGMPSCGFTWPVTGVQMCALHQRSHGCASVCVCVCMPCTSAATGVQVCACVPCISASSEAVGFHSSPAHPFPAGAPVLSDSGDFPALPLPSFSAPLPQVSQPDVGVGGQGGRERPTTFSGQPLTPDTLPPPVLGLLRTHPQCCSWD